MGAREPWCAAAYSGAWMRGAGARVVVCVGCAKKKRIMILCHGVQEADSERLLVDDFGDYGDDGR